MRESSGVYNHFSTPFRPLSFLLKSVYGDGAVLKEDIESMMLRSEASLCEIKKLKCDSMAGIVVMDYYLVLEREKRAKILTIGTVCQESPVNQQTGQ